MKLDPKSGLYLPEPIRRYSPEEQRRAERKWNRDWWKSRLAVTEVQNVASSLGATITNTATINPTAGNILVAVIYRYTTSGDPQQTSLSVSGSKSGAFTISASVAQTFNVSASVYYYLDMAYVLSAAGGSETITATYSRAVNNWITIYELTAGTTDQVSAATGNTTSSPESTASITTSVNGCCCVYAIMLSNGFGFASWWNAGNSITFGKQWGANGNSGQDAYFNQTSSGTLSGSGNFVPIYGSTGAGPYATFMATFKPSGGGGGSPLFLNQGDLNGMGVGGPFFKNPLG